MCGSNYLSGWKYPTLIICVYGFFFNMRPIEPFITPYYIGPFHNLTAEQVTTFVFPVWTYSSLAILIPVFLLTDYLRYKPVIILQALAESISLLLMMTVHGVPAFQVLTFFYSVSTSCEVAYFTYIYSVVDTEHYQRVTSYCRAVQLAGLTIGALCGQLLVSLAGVSYHTLNILSLTSSLVGLVCSFFLPMPSRSMFIHKKIVDETIQESSEGAETPQLQEHKQKAVAVKSAIETHSESSCCKRCFGLLVNFGKELKECYTTKQIIYWSLWVASGTAGFLQVMGYVQVLWEHVEPSGKISRYNGLVEATATFLSAVLSFLVGYVKVNWEIFGELVLAIFSAIGAGSIFLMAYARNIWVCYAGFLLFKSSYMILITIALYRLAVNLSLERYAMIFGLNNFVALVFQTILTLIVVDPKGLELDIITQYIVYGSYFAVIAGIFLGRSIYILFVLYCKGSVLSQHSAVKSGYINMD
ncbi:hypothetical protein GDO86_010305 [Hymenochirus boettgeri]|uniref:Thiamine transporter 2 n=1 Tax=Hymenochirus boettgeri TaxID=247094 RepID=A0A8T2JJP4_9PIPI|nr:hypothetical protein GDO86_010305 [Hymenochirus boettgeri]